MAVGILVGGVLSLWSGEEIVRGKEVIGIGELGATEDVEVIGGRRPPASKDDGNLVGEIGRANAVGIEATKIGKGGFMLGGCLGAGIKNDAIDSM